MFCLQHFIMAPMMVALGSTDADASCYSTPYFLGHVHVVLCFEKGWIVYLFCFIQHVRPPGYENIGIGKFQELDLDVMFRGFLRKSETQELYPKLFECFIGILRKFFP